ncbi:NAD(P)H-hydrate epimerase [Paracoccus aminophilus]|uniref:Bifunctional NAD(P)H-hydrate repair enzyme n=1 Tax=Paracoccus aminophilus JCM 7686 TaxID=1367847 RepID=S5Y902_PARAH|nr:NAD(P)H-hydrate epimerase [Paracoccus aminophilus]AGT07828.1 hypothetical protein JCM7686_0719 [Paracoccus aminophilus JCM 7686]
MGKDLFASRELLTSAQMRALENHAMATGLATGLALMERAGAAVAQEIRLRWPVPGRVVVLCGPGNNGGDGYVVARLLDEAGWQVRVLGLETAPGPDAAEMKRRWRERGGIEALTVEGLRREEADLTVDAIFGTGLTRPPEGEIAALLRDLGNAARDGHAVSQPLVAVDAPSGLCLDSGAVLGARRGADAGAPHARLTVTFDSPRRGHVLELGPALCGELVIADIGLARQGRVAPFGAIAPPIALMSGPRFAAEQAFESHFGHDELCRNLLTKSATGHKFSHGHALILAGGLGQGGAARLSAKAALRVGAGLVTLAPPTEALGEHALPPDALMRRAVDGPEDLLHRLEDKRITAALLGPGSGIERAAALLSALLETGRPTVLDADALTALSRRAEPLAGLHPGCVLTPHLGEFARLFPDLAEKLRGPVLPASPPPEDMAAALAWHAALKADQAALAAMRGPLYSKLDAVCEAAARAGCTVLLKGADTVIAGPDGPPFVQASSYDAAAPWLATAGSGDVLAGIILGAMARGSGPYRGARIGAALHAAAARSFGPGLIADDLPDTLPKVFHTLAI